MATNEFGVYGIVKDKLTADIENLQPIKESLLKHIRSVKKSYDKIIILNIGTDRCTGDSFAPLLGTILKQRGFNYPNVEIVGDLHFPVHAQNLVETINNIDQDNSLIIAVDASLTECGEIGTYTISNGKIKAGLGVGRDLPHIGDVAIAGTVAHTGADRFDNLAIIKNVRLSLVWKMAEVLSVAIEQAIGELCLNSSILTIAS